MRVCTIGTGCMYTKYNSACTLIDDEVIVDMPNGTVKQLLKKGFDVCKIKTILITHMHGDHTADIPFFMKLISLCDYAYGCLKIVGPRGIQRKFFELFGAFEFSDPSVIIEQLGIEFVEVSEGCFLVNGYEVDAFEVIHGEMNNCLGYVINKRLGLTGDSSLCPGVERIFDFSRVVISDTSAINGDLCHMGVDDLSYLISKYGKCVIATHLRDVTREFLLKGDYPKIKVVDDFYEFDI